MSEPTPGPWQATRESLGRLRIDPLAENSRLAIADVFIPQEGRAAEQGRANARLIASAPDLKAVAEAYERWEADLVLDGAAWGESLPRFTQQLYDRFIEIQAMRNAALEKARTAWASS